MNCFIKLVISKRELEIGPLAQSMKTLFFHYSTKRANLCIESNMSRRFSITVPYAYALKESTRYRKRP